MDHIRDSYIKVWQGAGKRKNLTILIRLQSLPPAQEPCYLLAERASEDQSWGDTRKLPLGEAAEWIATNGGEILFGGVGS